ncbi:MAG: hypothetical protein ACREXW_04185 [Gammaproteobacteria bacterium]
MIGLDTNVFARYYVEDKTDRESELQRDAARRFIDSGAPLAARRCMGVSLSVVIPR